MCEASGVLGEPAAEGGRVVAAAEEEEVGFGVEAFGGEAPGGEVGGGELFAEGGVAVGFCGGGVDEGDEAAAVVVEGDVGGVVELEEDGGADFGTEAFAEDAELGEGGFGGRCGILEVDLGKGLGGWSKATNLIVAIPEVVEGAFWGCFGEAAVEGVVCEGDGGGGVGC